MIRYNLKCSLLNIKLIIMDKTSNLYRFIYLEKRSKTKRNSDIVSKKLKKKKLEILEHFSSSS
jgi:hypothetical protein